MGVVVVKAETGVVVVMGVAVFVVVAVVEAEGLGRVDDDSGCAGETEAAVSRRDEEDESFRLRSFAMTASIQWLCKDVTWNGKRRNQTTREWQCSKRKVERSVAKE